MKESILDAYYVDIMNTCLATYLLFFIALIYNSYIGIVKSTSITYQVSHIVNENGSINF